MATVTGIAVPSIPLPFTRTVDKTYDKKRQSRLDAIRQKQQERQERLERQAMGSGGSSSRTGSARSSSVDDDTTTEESSADSSTEEDSSDRTSSSSRYTSGSDFSSEYTTSSETTSSSGSGSSGSGSARGSSRVGGSARSSGRGGLSARSTARSGSKAPGSALSGGLASARSGSKSARSISSESVRRKRKERRHYFLQKGIHPEDSVETWEKEKKTRWQRFQDWRARKAEESRYRGLIWFEEEHESFPDEAQLRELKQQRLRNQRRRKMLMASVKQKRVVDFKEMVQRKEDQRKAEDAQTRDYNFHKTMRMMKLLEKWGIDSAERKKVHEEQCEAQDKENRNPLAEEKLEMVKKVKKQIAEEQRVEDHKQTQEIVTMMRKSGTIAGVNPLPPDAHEDQMPTAKEVVLRNLSDEARSKLRGQAFSYFTVDLRHFRNVVYMKGEKIGPLGCRFLARTLKNGHCPKLVHLNLGWNNVKKLGGDSLVDCFANIPPHKSVMEHLDLRMNHIPPTTIQKLCDVLVQGNLCTLRILDLRHNSVGDDGAVALAQCMLKGGLKKLEELQLMHNLIFDTGTEALFKAFTSEEAPQKCPQIKCIDLRENPASPELKRRMSSLAPIFFQY